MPFTYMLRCADGALYVGSTTDLDLRLSEHARGAVDSYTSKRRPVQLVWFHEFERISEAAQFERKIKQWRREKKIALIEGRYADLPDLARTARTARDRSNRPKGPEPVEGPPTPTRRVLSPSKDQDPR